MRASDDELLIEAGRSEAHYWRDLWRYRGLLYFLAWRDVKVRYKQTAVGVAWVLLRPLLMLVVLTFVFNHIAEIGTGSDTPYILMAFVGLLPWQFFAAAFADSSNSLVANAQMVSKVYFPRLLVPLSNILAGLVDFLITLLLLIPLMLWFSMLPDLRMLLLPLLVFLVVAVTLSAGVALAALNVQYRDVRFIVPLVVQMGLYLSPIGYRAAEVPDEWRWLYDLNPMVGVVEGFRWSLLGGQDPFPAGALLTSCVVTALLLVVGIRYFRAVERKFADVI